MQVGMYRKLKTLKTHHLQENFLQDFDFSIAVLCIFYSIINYARHFIKKKTNSELLQMTSLLFKSISL